MPNQPNGQTETDIYDRPILEDVDDLEEGAVYSYARANPQDRGQKFQVVLDFVERDLIGLDYLDGYCSDLTVESVEDKIEDGRIVLDEEAA